MRITNSDEDKKIQELCIEWEHLVDRAQDLEWLVEGGDAMYFLDLILMALVHQDDTNTQRLLYVIKERLLKWVDDTEYFSKEIDTSAALYDKATGIPIRGEI